jgi:hypothetical protein
MEERKSRGIMQTTSEVKKGKKGIEDVIGSYSPQAVEERRDIAGGSVEFAGLMKKYERLLEEKLPSPHRVSDFIRAKNGIDDILTPKQISAFLQCTVLYQHDPNYYHATGMLISMLFQNSHDAGYNDFELNTKTTGKIHYLASAIKGTDENPIKVSITGDVGHRCGFKAEHSTINLTGNADKDCGERAKHSTFNVTGDIESHFGWGAEHSVFNLNGNTGEFSGCQGSHLTYNIQGNTRDYCGAHSEHSTYNIQGNIAHGCGQHAEHSTFKTANKDALKQFMRHVQRWRRNRIRYITPDGKEKRIIWSRIWNRWLRR